MFGMVVIKGVVKSGVAKLKWAMLGNYLEEGDGMTKEGQCVPPLPLNPRFLRYCNIFLFPSFIKLIKYPNMRIASSSPLHPLPFHRLLL